MESLAAIAPYGLAALAAFGLVGLAQWADISKPCTPLTEEAIRALLADTWPGEPTSRIRIDRELDEATAVCGSRRVRVRRMGDGLVHETLSPGEGPDIETAKEA